VAEPEVELGEEMEKMPPKKRTRDAVETLVEQRWGQPLRKTWKWKTRLLKRQRKERPHWRKESQGRGRGGRIGGGN